MCGVSGVCKDEEDLRLLMGREMGVCWDQNKEVGQGMREFWGLGV